MALNNGIVLITGATSGFGAATARLLALRWPKAKFWLTGRRRERLDLLVQELGSARARGFAFDISDRSAVAAFAQENAAQLGEVSVLVNNAGLALGLEPFQEAQLDDWDQMIDTNIKGLLYITRALLPSLIQRGEAHIINIGSVAGHQMYPKGHVYAATKAAVRALNEALRLDTLGSGLRVTSIAPGMAETEFSQVRFRGDAGRAQNVYAGMRPLTATDVAEAIVWSLERPAHVNVQELLLMPTDQASPRDVARK